MAECDCVIFRGPRREVFYLRALHVKRKTLYVIRGLAPDGYEIVVFETFGAVDDNVRLQINTSVSPDIFSHVHRIFCAGNIFDVN